MAEVAKGSLSACRRGANHDEEEEATQGTPPREELAGTEAESHATLPSEHRDDSSMLHDLGEQKLA